jgi:DNA-binding CsgD family transcriptional regulator
VSEDERSACASATSCDERPIDPDELRAAIEDVSQAYGWEAAADLFQDHWDLYATRAPEALLEALKGLPGDAFVARPSMLVAADYLHQLASGQDPHRFHDGARDLFGGSREPRDLVDSLISLTGRAAGARTDGRLDVARQRALEARHILDRADEIQQAAARGALPHLTFQWGRCLEVADAEGAIAEYEQSHELAVITGQDEIARRAAGSLAWLLAERGRLIDARVWLARAHATDRESPRYDAPIRLAAALLAADDLDDELAERELARVDDDAVGEYWAARQWVRAYTARGPLAPLIARHAIAGEAERRVSGLLNAGANRRYLVRAAIALENELGEDVSAAAPSEGPASTDLLRRAASLVRAGAHPSARTQARAALAADPAPRDEASALLLLAATKRVAGDADASSASFRKAHTLIAHEGLWRAYLAVGRADLEALFAESGFAIPERVAADIQRRETTQPSAEPDLGVLTRREREILVLIADELSFADIARELYISPNTVKTLARGLYRKLGVHSRAEAAAIARRP